MSEEIGKSLLERESVLRFVQYAAAYCALVEPSEGSAWDRASLQECKKCLAQVYASACDLPELHGDPFYTLETFVQESDYERVRGRMERVFGEHDYFLNAQMEGQQYSDRPIGVSTSELLADLYQVLADTVWVFRTGVEKSMYQAIAEVKYTFAYEWGTLLLAALRQIHDLLASPHFYLQSELESDEV